MATNRFFQFPLLPMVLLTFFLIPNLFGMGSGYRLELTLEHENGKFTVKTRVNTKIRYDFESDPAETLKPFFLDARKKLADKRGYPQEVYGKDHYMMVPIKKYNWILFDSGNDSIVLKKEGK